MRRYLLALVLATVGLILPQTASAAQSAADTLTGYEYYATSTDGRFAGQASGTLPGAWNANIQHTALCLSCTPTATITGGSFTLSTGYTLVTGSFTSGTVRVINPGPGCTRQTFAVNGSLGDVGRWYSGGGTGSFAVTLTHYRRSILGRCVTYGASVAGTLMLTF